MTKQSKNVEKSGKVPDNTKNDVFIPEEIYSLLLDFRDNRSDDDTRQLFYNMLASAMKSDDFNGDTYCQMLDLYDFFCKFTNALERFIPDEFKRKLKVA